MSTIREVMKSPPIAIRRDEPLRHAVELLIDNGISGLPVVDDESRLVGVVSEKDLLKIFHDPEARTIDSVMTPSPISMEVDSPLVDLVDCLMANDFRRVFVHEGGRLVGLVSRADLMPAILAALLERS